MKILILGNQARSTSNFWTVLMRRMRAAGHEVLCAVPAGDDAAEAAIRAIGEEDPAFRKGPAVRLCHYPLDRKGLNPLRDMATMHALYRLFKQEKPDLLFASTIKPVIYGCICAAHDPRALAAAMRRLLDEPGLLVRMGAAGRDLACREFDAEVVAEKILVDMRVPRAAG